MPMFSLKQARAYRKDKNYAAAVANYMSVLKFRPDKVEHFEKEFFDCFKHFCADLEANNRITEINEYFLTLSDIFSRSGTFFYQWGAFMMKHGLFEEAALCFMKTLSFDEDSPPGGESATDYANFTAAAADTTSSSNSILAKAGSALNDLRDQLIDQWHFRMLNDLRRNKSYETAIKQTLLKLKDSTVLDLGSGTGILSMIAATSGAKTVFACEHSPIMCHVAKNVLSKNSLFHKINLLEKNSFAILTDSEIKSNSVDVLIAELMDAGFFGENMVGVLLDAKKRFLTDSGIIIPGKVRIYATAAECRKIREENYVENFGDYFGFLKSNFSLSTILSSDLADSEKLTEPYDSLMLNKVKGGYRFLSEPTVIFAADLNNVEQLEKIKNGLTFEYSSHIICEGRLDAVVSWFEVELIEGVTLSTDPRTETSWEQAVFPLAFGNSVKIEDQIKFDVVIRENWFRIIRKIDRFENAELSSIVAHSNLISCLNDNITANSFRLLLESFSKSAKICINRVLDVSQEPLLCFLVAKLFDANVKTVQDQENHSIFRYFFENNPEFVEKIRIFTRNSLDLEDDRKNPVEKIDILICNPVDWTSGLLKPNALEDIIFYKVKYGPEKIFPSRIDVFAVLIESDELSEYGKIISDERTLKFRVKDSLNVFAPELFREIEYSTTEFRILSEKRRIFSLNFEEISKISSAPGENREEDEEFVVPDILCQKTRAAFSVVENGRLDALLFWYEFYGCCECDLNISTIDEANRFKTAAFLMRKSMEISKNEIVHVAAILERSKFKFNVEKNL